jgi:hypothetical protein
VAATGALLLLAAAGTFLAVAWDTMGLASRVAVVAAGTGAAILGGHRLRRPLPAVGGVVFHLGALLVPLDVLGLTLRLEVDPAGRWLATGAVAVLAWGLLATLGRSPVLAWSTVAAVPVLATGIGLAGALPPPAVVVLAAGLAVVAVRAPGAPAVLAVASVLLPVAIAAATAADLVGRLGPDLVAAGWATRWDVSVVVGLLALGVLAVVATRREDAVAAAATPVVALLTGVLVVADGRTPQLAALLVVPVLALTIELAALATVRDRFWSRTIRPVAVAGEVLGLALVPVALWLVLDRGAVGSPSSDLALVAAVLAAAWCAAAARRVVAGGWRRDLVVALSGTTVLFLGAAAALGWPGAPGAAWVVVGGAVASVAWLPSRASRPAGAPRIERGWPAAIAMVVTATGLAVTAVWSTATLPGVATVAAGALLLHVGEAARAHREDAAAALAVLLPATILLFVVVAAAPALTVLTPAVRAVALAAMLLVLAATSDRVPVAADLTRATAALAALVVPAGPLPWRGTDPDQLLVLDLLRPTPEALLVTLLVTAWLLLDASRHGRPRIAAFAVPVALRGWLAVAAAATLALPVAGVVLLVVAAVLAGVAAVVAGPLRLPAVVAAVTWTLPGWMLLGAADHLRAWTLVVYGAIAVSAGLLRRQPPLAHLGGVVTTLGTWWLFSQADVTATDVWMLPVAAQLWIAGALARRRGTSSWIADVPPLLLVAVPALAERLAGGPGGHSFLAGVLAVVAVAGGGVRRLGGPLVVGSVLVVAVVLVETFALVASVPTWAWLAVGGSLLLAVAVVIERRGTSPVASARRLVEVIDARFD